MTIEEEAAAVAGKKANKHRLGRQKGIHPAVWAGLFFFAFLAIFDRPLGLVFLSIIIFGILMGAKPIVKVLSTVI